jgi:HlyD family secretion protein
MQLTQLQNQYELAKLKYDQAKTISDQLKEELSKMIILSPIDGIINLLAIKKGEFTSLGKAVAEIYDTKNMEIRVYVSEANIGHIKVGQDVNIYVDSDSEQSFKGNVIRINNSAEFTPKNIQTKEERINTVFEVKIQVLDSKGVIKAGMPVDVSIKID